MEFAGGDGVDAIGAGSEANAWGGGDFDGALGRDGDFGVDDVFVPVAGAGGDVAGERKVGQGGHGDVVGATDAGFEHAAAPIGDGIFLAEILDAFGLQVTADAAELDVDDFAGAERGGGFGLFVGVDALVEADGRLELLLEFDVVEEIVPAEGLLDHHEIEGIELLEELKIFER